MIAGRVAITMGERAVYGIDVGTGEVLWSLARAAGPLSIPAVGVLDGRTVLVFVEGPDGQKGAGQEGTGSPGPAGSPDAGGSPQGQTDGSTLVAVDLSDRTELWRIPLEAASRSGITVEGRTAYVGDQDGNVYAVSLADGRRVWTAEVAGRVDAPVAAADGNVYVVGRDAEQGRMVIAAFDAGTGEPLWPAVSPQVGSTAGSAPAAGDAALIVGTADRLVRSIDGESGQPRWSSLVLSIFSPVTSPAFQAGNVYLADLSGGLYRLDASDGSRDWSYQFNELVVRSSPVVSGSTVLLGLNDGRLVAVDVTSGTLVWQSAATPGLVGTIALSHEVVVAVKGGKQAGLIAFEHDPGGRLIEVPSPTELDVGATLARFGLAAVIVLAGALVPGFLARRRFGDAGLGGWIQDDAGDGDDGGRV